MSTLALDHVYRLVYQMRTIDKLHTFGMHYWLDTGFDAVATAEQLADAVDTAVTPVLRDVLSVDTTVEGLYVSHVLPDTALPFSKVFNSLPGLRPGNALPPNSCLVVSFYSDEPELSRPGRVYVGGLSKTDLDAGRWDGTFLNTEVDVFRSTLGNDIAGTGGPYSPVVVRRTHPGIPGGPFAVIINSTRVTDGVFSQNRRTTKQFGTQG